MLFVGVRNKYCSICARSENRNEIVHQGQLAICGAAVCYFVIYTGDKNDLFIQPIFKDSSKWNDIWLPKLIQVYKSCLAPEIILNRRGQNLKCKEPASILEAQEKRKQLFEEAHKTAREK